MKQGFNNWPGLAAARLPPCAAEAGVIQAFERHVHDVLCAGEDGAWFLDYLASVVQRPSEPTRVAVLFSSLPGAGKNLLLDFVRTKVLGERVTCQMDDPRAVLFGRFATVHAHCVWMQWDEVRIIYGCVCVCEGDESARLDRREPVLAVRGQQKGGASPYACARACAGAGTGGAPCGQG